MYGNSALVDTEFQQAFEVHRGLSAVGQQQPTHARERKRGIEFRLHAGLT